MELLRAEKWEHFLPLRKLRLMACQFLVWSQSICSCVSTEIWTRGHRRCPETPKPCRVVPETPVLSTLRLVRQVRCPRPNLVRGRVEISVVFFQNAYLSTERAHRKFSRRGTNTSLRKRWPFNWAQQGGCNSGLERHFISGHLLHMGHRREGMGKGKERSVFR